MYNKLWTHYLIRHIKWDIYEAGQKLYIILCFTLTDFDTRIGRLRIMTQQNVHITPCVLLWKTIPWNCTSVVSFILNTVVVRTSTGSQLCSTLNLLYARPTNICSGLTSQQFIYMIRDYRKWKVLDFKYFLLNISTHILTLTMTQLPNQHSVNFHYSPLYDEENCKTHHHPPTFRYNLHY